VSVLGEVFQVVDFFDFIWAIRYYYSSKSTFRMAFL